MRIAIYCIVGFVLMFAALYGWGVALPAAHTVRVFRQVNASPEQVFERVTDFASHAKWRKDVKSVKFDASTSRVVEVNSMGELPYVVVRKESPTLLETRIDSGRELGFGGTWLFEFERSSGGTLVTITERGEVYSPMFRVMGKLFFPADKTAKSYLEDLALSFNRG